VIGTLLERAAVAVLQADGVFAEAEIVVLWCGCRNRNR
jgi:hypothetical protein